MTFPDSVRFLYSLGNEVKTLKLGLERIESALEILEHPERQLRFVHVAGTNGKGSVCAMIERGLREAGYRTGLYTSPHLVSPTERIRINGEPVSEEAFARAFNTVHTAVAGFEQHPSYFETVTAMAMLIFAEERCDWVVLEVGLGGRLDATNVVTPELCVITPVSLDHQEHLGDTVAKIAFEKAGILKNGVPAVISKQQPDAMTVIRDRAMKLDVPLIETAGHTPLNIAPPLAGKHQIDNTLTAVVALEALGLAGDVIERGVSATVWPGRLERVRTAPDLYLDGAHNVAGAQALAEFIRDIRGERRVWMVFGVMRDKNVAEMSEALFPLADVLILTTPASDRARAVDAIPAPPGTRFANSVEAALDELRAAGPDDIIFITGSLFLVGEARALLSS